MGMADRPSAPILLIRIFAYSLILGRCRHSSGPPSGDAPTKLVEQGFKRLTFILIENVGDPLFMMDQASDDVLGWLESVF